MEENNSHLNTEGSQVEEDQGIRCIKCHNIPDSFIALNCGHNFCLFCLSENYKNSKKINKSQQLLFCDICQTQTLLDAASIEALEEIINQRVIFFLFIIFQNKKKDNIF